MSENVPQVNNKYTPYKFWQPRNTMLLFSFFSPFIIIFFFTFLGMYFSSWTGLLFLATFLITLLFRIGIYKWLFTSLTDDSSNACDLINYSGIGTGDIYLSLWVFSFTLFYILIPLISSNGIERSLFVFLTLFILMFICDIFIKFYHGCYNLNFKEKKVYNILFNILIGGLLGLLLSLFFSMNSALKKHLFFTSKSSSETCKQVNETKFQCSFDFE